MEAGVSALPGPPAPDGVPPGDGAKHEINLIA